jgi:alkylation response protein AidB-like acyl-CoA dehydrogenase
MITHFGLEDRHREHRERVRSFVEDEIEPVVEDYERRGEFPLDVVDALGEAGLYGITIPEAYGGAGLDFRSFVLTVEELARVWKIPAGVVSLTCSLVSNTLVEHGDERQQREWLKPIFAENQVTALALTEPQAGSDAASIETRATRDGDDLVLDGHKVWCSHGAVADLILAVVRTEGDGDYDEVTMVGIPDPASVDGLEFVRDIPCMEGEAVVETEIEFADARIPAHNVVGKPGNGFRMVLGALDLGRIGAAAQGVGVAQGAFDAAVDFADEREQFGQSIREFQGISFKLADMAMNIEAARLLTLWAASRRDRGHSVTQEASMAKTFAADVAMETTTEAVQVHGSRGYSKDYPVERYMREAKGIQIYEGTSEVNRQLIADNLYDS